MSSFMFKLLMEEGKNLDVLMMSLRAFILFIVTLIFIRAAKKRFLGKNSSFDVVLSIVLGSILSRTVNGSAPFLPTLAAVIVIILMHHVVTYITSRYPGIGKFLEGTPEMLMKNGKPDNKQLLRHHIKQEELTEAARLHLQQNDLSSVEQSYIENNGKITIVEKK